MSKPLDLKFLYYFSCASILVLEVKIDGLDERTPIDSVFHWLYYDRASEQFQKLGFKSMGSEGGRDYRIFEQGELWFDASHAILKLTNSISKEFALEVNQMSSISDELISQVQDFLQQKLSGLSQ
jgi:hypothetical protein